VLARGTSEDSATSLLTHRLLVAVPGAARSIRAELPWMRTSWCPRSCSRRRRLGASSPESRSLRRPGRSSPRPRATAWWPGQAPPSLRSLLPARRRGGRGKLSRARGRACSRGGDSGRGEHLDGRLGMRAAGRRASAVEHWMERGGEQQQRPWPQQQQRPWQMRSMPATTLIKCSTKCQR
jgi:hypothetical protein